MGTNMTDLMQVSHEKEVTGSQSLGPPTKTGPARDCRAESVRTTDVRVLVTEQVPSSTSEGG